MCGSEVRRDPNLGTVITDLRDIWATAADVQASKRVRRPTTLPPSPLVALQTLTRTRSLSLCTRPPSPPAAYILHLLGTHLLVCTLALYLRTQADQRHLGEAKGRCAAETRRETGRVCVCVCVWLALGLAWVVSGGGGSGGVSSLVIYTCLATCPLPDPPPLFPPSLHLCTLLSPPLRLPFSTPPPPSFLPFLVFLLFLLNP